MSEIPVSVVVVTKNEEDRLPSCLEALSAFDDVFVVDSQSTDQSQNVAQKFGVQVVDYEWNGQYPKKRGWCLKHLKLKYDWVFFVDADELVHPFLIDELCMLQLDQQHDVAGYFVQGQYIFEGVMLQHGLRNLKIALFHKDRMEFPVVDDLDVPGMGEIEGHYQPVLKVGYENMTIERLYYPVIHEAYTDPQKWEERHMRYAAWEQGMNRKKAWPKDPNALREFLKSTFRILPFRGQLAFLHSYVFKQGYLDGDVGYRFAKSRQRYYQMISDANKAQDKAS